MEENVKVAVVIVCMNNLKNLVPCLDSIAKYTSIEHEVWVNAYMFSGENLKIVREKYPYVHWVINNEIAGFAENNNLILRQLHSEYVLILNDDTEFKEPVIDELLKDLEQNVHISIISPVLYLADGSVQFCGRNPSSMFNFILEDSSIAHLVGKKSKYINKQGLFQTYNISGACFMIKRNDFESLGWFDEYYFFSPEDIALSTLANNKGLQCWVDANVGVTHYSGQTRKSYVKTATLPALRIGSVHFYSRGNLLVNFFLRTMICLFSLGKSVYFKLKGDEIECLAQLHSVAAMLSAKSPKQIFIKYYNQISLASR